MTTKAEPTIRHFEDEATQKFLRGILKKDQSIPFLGTGFTAGERSRGGVVPFGKEWMEIMRSQIRAASVSDKPSDEELEGYGFQELSDIYFREEVVDLDKIKDTINAVFTKVNISSAAKKEFLNVDWPYIYTLNIDDAIENCIDAVKVLPYRDFSTYRNRRYVYKLHGDAEDVLIAPKREGLKVVFGRGDYIRSLEKNKRLLADLANDFAEKHIIFIGCSLTDEIDISFALVSTEDTNTTKGNARVYVTSTSPKDYTTRMNLKKYGITDVIVVNDYEMFYSFAAHTAQTEDTTSTLLGGLAFTDATIRANSENRIAYLVQNGWRQIDDPYLLSIPRACEKVVKEKIVDPIVVIWGRRFSGKTTLLFRLLNEIRTRKRFYIKSTGSISDRLFNELLLAKDALIAIDTHVLDWAQLNLLANKADRFRENNTTLLIAINKSDLNAFGYGYAQDAIELHSRLNQDESDQITSILDTFGFKKWSMRETILENVFSLAKSPILSTALKGKSRLDERLKVICDTKEEGKVSKLEFACLYYLAVQQRMYSRVHRVLCTAHGIGYMADAHLDAFSRKWAPFVECDIADPDTNRAENSRNVLVCNSYSWVQFALRTISEKLGIEKSAELIANLFTNLKEIEDSSYELVLFDSLNAIYETQFVGTHDWRAAIIRLVYERLSAVMSQDPDYWLQRAKAIYYMSGNEDELRVAIAYCEKGIIEKKQKTWMNAKLTKANLLGKLCVVAGFSRDEDLIRAVLAYAEAIEDRNLNPVYIDSLLTKSREGISNMSKVVKAASSRASLLTYKGKVQYISSYLAGN